MGTICKGTFLPLFLFRQREKAAEKEKLKEGYGFPYESFTPPCVLFLTKKKNDRPPFLPLFVELALPLELVPLALDAAVGIRE